MDLREELYELKQASNEIINDFIKDNFEEEEVANFNRKFSQVIFDLDENPQTAETVESYYEETMGGRKKIYWSKLWLEEYKGTMKAITNTIHELSHYYSGSPSKESGGTIMEEAMANLFAEICVNNYIQKEKEIPYINQEEYNELKETGYTVNYNYKRPGGLLRSIMSQLKEKGKDIEAIKAYVFEGKEKFREICVENLGSEYGKVLDNIAKISVETANNEDYEKLEKDTANILSNLTDEIEEEETTHYVFKEHKLKVMEKNGASIEEIQKEREKLEHNEPEKILERYEKETKKDITLDLQAIIELQSGNEEEQKIANSVPKDFVYQEVKEAIDILKNAPQMPGFTKITNTDKFLIKINSKKYKEAKLKIEDLNVMDLLKEDFSILNNYIVNYIYEELKEGNEWEKEKIKEKCKSIISMRESLEGSGIDKKRIDKIEEELKNKELIELTETRETEGLESTSQIIIDNSHIPKDINNNNGPKDTQISD